jgi:hypothetical protein
MLSRCIPNRGGGEPKFIVLHIQEGRTSGSLEHWVAGRKNDGDPITASSTVMIQKDGSVLKVIPEEHGPWTNGDIKRPTAQSKKLRDLGDPNKWSLTIEAEGSPDDAMPDAQFKAIVWQVYDWMARYNIPLKNILPHSSINSVTRSHCPGPYYRRVIAAFDGSIGYKKPQPPPPFDGQPKIVNGKEFHPFRKQVTSKGVNRREWATSDADLTGPSIPAGTKITVYYWVEGEKVDGNNVWVIDRAGSRIWSGGVEESVP